MGSEMRKQRDEDTDGRRTVMIMQHCMLSWELSKAATAYFKAYSSRCMRVCTAAVRMLTAHMLPCPAAHPANSLCPYTLPPRPYSSPLGMGSMGTWGL